MTHSETHPFHLLHAEFVHSETAEDVDAVTVEAGAVDAAGFRP
jgi:hypothetical protein